MRADRLVYNLDTGEIHAIGDVQIALEDGSVTYAEEIEADEAMNVGAARELRARIGGNGTLAARAAVRRGEGQSELRNVIYTSCPICTTGDRPPTWSLRARRAVQNRDTRTISYQGAVLELAGVPVLYLPFMAHPDPSVERASGLLPPNIGRNQRLGTFYDQPYFWAISPSQDLTASLRLHGNVNPLMGLQYRKRFFSGDAIRHDIHEEGLEQTVIVWEKSFRYSFWQGAFRNDTGTGASASKISTMTNIAGTISMAPANAAVPTLVKTRA
jgi:LPS-assembly protein